MKKKSIKDSKWNQLYSNKKIYFQSLGLVFGLLFGTNLMAQTGVGINDDNSDPNASAMLDVKSTTKGMLVPRMTTTQRTAVVFPATGLLVFDNTTTSFWFYDGAAWIELGASGTGWDLRGNAGTVDGINFIGTTDNVPFNIRVNNQKAGRIDRVLDNSFYGYQAGNSNTTGDDNTAIGYRALYLNTTGYDNTSLGKSTLYNNTTGYENTATGKNTLFFNTTGNFNTASGYRALYHNTIGYDNTATGKNGLYENTTGYSNTATGRSTLYNNTTGYENTAIGRNALNLNTTGSNNTAIGYDADVTANNLTNATAIGANALVSRSDALVLGNNANVGIGTSTPSDKLHIIGTSGTTLRIEDTNEASGYVLTSDANGNASWADPTTLISDDWTLVGNAGTVDGINFIGTTDNVPFNIRVNNEKAGRIDRVLDNSFYGYQAGNSNTTGDDNTAIGYRALYLNTTGYENTALGKSTLYSNTTGYDNTATGKTALYNNTTGYENTATGRTALYYNTTGNYNTASGYRALFSNISGLNNTATGRSALYNNTTGYENTAIGRNALNLNTTGNNNTAIGYDADVTVNNLTNATAIGANALVSRSDALVLGNNANVGIGTSSPTDKLHIVGTSGTTLRIEDTNEASGYVLTSDANGNASWADPATLVSDDWTLVGNAGTVDGTNFIGTTDNVPLNFRVNNQKAGRIDHVLDNSFYGYQAGNSNTTGDDNTAIGYRALYLNTTGYDNTALGKNTLYNNTTGYENTATGRTPLYNNTTGNENTASGYRALFSNTSGDENTATGKNALYSNTTGDENTATGKNALYSNTTGYNNTAIGNSALILNTTGYENTAIGYLATVQTGDLTNATAIGANSFVSQSNSLILGRDADVGIGVSAPTSKLHVVGSSDYIAEFVNTTNANGISIQVQAAKPRNINNFVTFLNSSGITVGRIEGESLLELTTTNDDYILDKQSQDLAIALASIDVATATLNLAIATADVVAASASSTGCVGFGACVTVPIPSLIVASLANVVSEGINLTAVSVGLADAVIHRNAWVANQQANVGVTYQSGAGDYAEYLPKLNLTERMIPGYIVGVKNGFVSLNTADANQILAISTKPIVLGNSPKEGEEGNYEKVAFMGQVPIHVIGKVNLGDYILPSGFNNGFGRAVAPEDMLPSDYEQIVGVAWSSSADAPHNMINVAIGLNAGDVSKVVSKQNEEIKELKTILAELVPGFKEKMGLSDEDVASNQPSDDSKAHEDYNLTVPSGDDIIYHEITESQWLEGIEMARNLFIEGGGDEDAHPFWKLMKENESYKSEVVAQLKIKLEKAIQTHKIIND